MLDRLIPNPRLRELSQVELGAPPERVWERLRHGNLATSPAIRALFALRGLPRALRGEPVDRAARIDALKSTAEEPGFQILLEDAPREFAVGAIGKVWHANIPFVHVNGAREFAEFAGPDFVKVAWSIRALPWGEHGSRVELEVRVDATDEPSWRKFRRYFRVIGPGSHFIRRAVVGALVHEFGGFEIRENERALAGDELLPDATAELTHGITIAAPPERIWPWLLQMGCRRAGFYAVDALDNGFARSARELHPELQELRVGQVIPATPEGDEGFEVLRIEPARALVLGGLYDSGSGRQLAFAAPRPERFWQVSWAFALEPLDRANTRLSVRARATFSPSERLRAAASRPVHHFMQRAMLRHLAERAEGRLARDDLGDVVEGIGGASVMIAAFLSPFLRRSRSHWGLDPTLAARAYPGDELVREPRWSFTHGIEIRAPAAQVWPWIAQIGADRAGFYSYQWLENLVGCEVRNAVTIHPEWQARAGQSLALHPEPMAPRLPIVAVEPGRHVLTHAPADERARDLGEAWTAVTWLLLVEPIDETRCRFISRYRAACSDDAATRLAFGPTLLEPISFAMDRRMLLGVKQRAERAEGTARAG